MEVIMRENFTHTAIQLKSNWKNEVNAEIRTEEAMRGVVSWKIGDGD
jgi:hypothetical protein